MLYGQVIEIFNEANLSPEDLAGWIGVSNSTYRRWQKEPVKGEFPKEYTQNVSTGVFRLLTSRKLSYDSERVSNFVEKNIPEYFASAIGQLSDTQELFVEGSTHQDNITAVLSQLGSSSGSRKRVDDAKKEIAKFTGWGSEWKRRIRLLSRVIVDKRLTLVGSFSGIRCAFLPDFTVRPYSRHNTRVRIC